MSAIRDLLDGFNRGLCAQHGIKISEHHDFGREVYRLSRQFDEIMGKATPENPCYPAEVSRDEE